MTRWESGAREVLASTFYVQNWMLATRAVDYSALDDAASPVQHFWSLSVEEQFYLCWPPLILLLVAVARRARRADPSALVLPGILVVTLTSFAYSVYATAHTPAAAYFVTPTRVWELGAGALLALWTRNRVRPPSRHAPVRTTHLVLLRWSGVVAVLAGAVLLSSASPFPGWLALLPVLGTVAVIAAGATGPGDPLGRLFDARPTQFVGLVSYSLYLWHWPVLVIAPFVIGHPLRTMDKVLLIVGCTVLAWLTKLFVEDSAQRWRQLSTRPLATAVIAVVAMLAVAGLAGQQLREVAHREDEARTILAGAASQPCFGAPAMLPGSGCADVFGPAASVAQTPEDEPWRPDPACQPSGGAPATVTCRFGDAPPTRRVVLIGDSHADHWRAALHRVAAVQGWELVEVLHGGCPAVAAQVLTFNGDPIDTAECHAWGEQVEQLLASDPPDYVFTSSFASAYTFAPDGQDAFETATQAYADRWTAWADTGAEVFVLQDIPTTDHRQVPECVAQNRADPLACALPRDRAFPPDPARAAASRVDSPGVRQLDFSNLFCDDAHCYAVIGGALVYWDNNHMSAQFSRTLAPQLLDRVLAVD